MRITFIIVAFFVALAVVGALLTNSIAPNPSAVSTPVTLFLVGAVTVGGTGVTWAVVADAEKNLRRSHPGRAL